jgi:hypothetical protein
MGGFRSSSWQPPELASCGARRAPDSTGDSGASVVEALRLLDVGRCGSGSIQRKCAGFGFTAVAGAGAGPYCVSPIADRKRNSSAGVEGCLLTVSRSSSRIPAVKLADTIPRFSRTFNPRRDMARRDGSYRHGGFGRDARAILRSVFRESLGGLLGVPRGLCSRKFG